MNHLQRRRFIAALAALPIGAGARSGESRVLHFSHLHRQRLEVEYFSAGVYLPDALGAVNHLLRDFRSGDVGTIDPALLDLLHNLRERTGTQRPFQIISGYRSPSTNQMLHERSSGVAPRRACT